MVWKSFESLLLAIPDMAKDLIKNNDFFNCPWNQKDFDMRIKDGLLLLALETVLSSEQPRWLLKGEASSWSSAQCLLAK